MIDVKNLKKNYGDVVAVNGVSFQVQPKEVVGLLGPNGAGKSTTLRVLTGYLPPSDGSVTIDGIDILEHPLEARRRIGYLSETNPLYDSLGVWECLEMIAGLRGLERSRVKEAVLKAAERCSILDVISRDVNELSKGYRQRLGLALAILHDPSILILDEPTSALDPNQQQEVRDLILDLKKQKTVILSTHILPEAQNLCDRLLIINGGRIVAQGTFAEMQKQMQGAPILYVRLQGPEFDMASALRTLPGVLGLDKVDEEEPGSVGFHLSAEGDPRREVFQLAAARGWPILEMHRRSASLDEIFRSLTGGS